MLRIYHNIENQSFTRVISSANFILQEQNNEKESRPSPLPFAIVAKHVMVYKDKSVDENALIK